MLLSDKEIAASKKEMEKRAKEMEQQREFYHMLSDVTRLKVLSLLGQHEELCPTDLSQVLNISMSAISHQLRLLEMVGLTSRKKQGKTICYTLTEAGRDMVAELVEQDE